MESFELLEKKIRQAAEQIAALRQEREELLARIRELEEEGSTSKDLMRECETLREQRSVAAHRVEKLLKKINSLKV